MAARLRFMSTILVLLSTVDTAREQERWAKAKNGSVREQMGERARGVNENTVY